MVAEERALGPAEREGGLAGDELREPRVHPRRRAPVAAAQVTDRRGLARHHRRPLGLPARDPRLCARGWAPAQRTCVQRHHVRPAHPPAALALTGQPRHPHGDDRHVDGELGERPSQRVRVDGELFTWAYVVGPQPLRDEPTLDLAVGIDQHDGPVHPPILAHPATAVTPDHRGFGAHDEPTTSPDRVGAVTTCDRALLLPERGAEPTVKVAHLVPTLHSDGPEIGLVDLAGVARQADIDMIVIALSVSSDAAEVGALRRAGVPVAELDLFPWDPRAVPRTAKLLREQHVEIVHTHLPQADVVGAAAAARNRIPAVSTLHRIHNEPADRVDRLKRSAKILARQRFMTRTIAISQVQREWYRSLAGPETDVLLVPNGVVDPGVPDDATRARRRAALEVDDHDVVALSTAPMRRDQGHELLLDAVEALPDDLPLVLALAGEGPLRPWLESRVAATDALADRVRFTHRHREPAELLAAADLFVHTASAAALPTAVLRAMAMELPTIATRVGGIPEVITSDTGILVALDPAAVARALTTLTDDPARREKLGAGARARFLAEYDARAWARRLHDVYQSALDTWTSRTNASTAASGSGHTARS